MKWLSFGYKLFTYIVRAVQTVEEIVTNAKGKPKEDAAIAIINAILQTVDTEFDKVLAHDPDVNNAARAVIRTVVALENILARKKAGG